MPKIDSIKPRNRLLDTARMLFLQRGIPQTGINSVTDAANVARMTLYNNFSSKEALVLAVFQRESETRQDAIEASQKALVGPFETVLAMFDVARDLAALDGFRGCAFINLAVETAAPNSELHDLAKMHKTWIFNNVLSGLDKGNFASADILARQICVLWDGGIVGTYIQQNEEPIVAARDAARTLMNGSVL